MQPKEHQDSGQNDIFRARLDQIVDTSYPLAKLAAAIDGRFWKSGSAQSIRTDQGSRRCRRV